MVPRSMTINTSGARLNCNGYPRERNGEVDGVEDAHSHVDDVMRNGRCNPGPSRKLATAPRESEPPKATFHHRLAVVAFLEKRALSRPVPMVSTPQCS
jgi:hypothetical protein